MAITIQVEEVGSRVVNSRRTATRIGNKTLISPFYGTLMKRRYELEDVVYKSAESLSNPQILVMKLYDCKDIILNAETRSRMRNLEGKRLDQVYVDLRANKIWLVDAVPDEYYYTKGKDNVLLKFKGFSESTKDIMRELNPKTHVKIWKRLYDNKTRLLGLIKEIVNAEAEGKPDVITAPSPLLTVTDPGYMTDIWYEVVKTTAVYAATNLDKPSTISINVHKNIFGDRRRLDLILKKLRDETTEIEIGNIRLITLKILMDDTDLQNETGIAKDNYRYFILGLSDYAKITKRLLVLLNINSLGLASIALGADGFAEPMDGHLGLFGRSSTIRRGARYNADALRSYPYDDWVRINPAYASMTDDEWKLDKRLHLLKERDGEIQECHKAIIDKTIYIGTKAKIARSEVKNYIDIVK